MTSIGSCGVANYPMEDDTSDRPKLANKSLITWLFSQHIVTIVFRSNNNSFPV